MSRSAASKRLVGASVAAILAAACGSNPLGPADPVPILDAVYVFSCGGWSPAEPPAWRTLVDLTVWNGGAGSQPALEVVDVIKASNGRIRRVFNTSRLRVEINVPQIEVIYRIDGRVIIERAETVDDPLDVHLRVAISYDRSITADDLARIAALGGVVDGSTSTTVTAIVDDPRLPEIRALPGVVSAEDAGAGTSCGPQR